MAKQTLHNAQVNGKRVLVRVDFNVPLKNGEIQDDTRIRAALPTIQWLVEEGASVVLISHLGRPDGKVVDDLRLGSVGERLSELLDQPVKTSQEVIGEDVQQAIESLEPGDVLLLENLRFDPREEQNDRRFSEELAAAFDLYVNDAFGAAHRAHASTVGVAELTDGYLGFLMEKEVQALGKLLENPDRPFAAIIGGAKVSDKIKVLQNLVPRVDALLIGGGMANTFLLAQGHQVGKSLVEKDQVDVARALIAQCEEADCRLVLPTDVIVAPDIKAETGTTRSIQEVADDEAIFDIGPESAQTFAEIVANMKTILWNGPLGVAENPAFAEGTKTVAQAVANANGYTVIGGGDSVAAIEKLGLADEIDHISTGGGASLEFLEGKTLPGIAAIPDAKANA